MSVLLLPEVTTLDVSLKCVQHLEEVEPWVDELSQRLHHISSIERHRKYLLCLQHIEELRYVAVSGKRAKPMTHQTLSEWEKHT